MDLWTSLQGTVELKLTCADTAMALRHVTDAGVEVFDAVGQEQTTDLCFRIRRLDLPKVQQVAHKRGYSIDVQQKKGIYWYARRLLKRPILVGCVAILCAMALFLPSRIFFIRVEGNESVPTRLILEKCEACGIGFGASRKAVRSQKMKDSLLEALPQLQWAGINTSGCVATITVRERQETESTDPPVSSIVALRDGIITDCVVTRGFSQCTVGQVVRAGQLLVSGYNDCGTCIQVSSAEAEIYAQTQRSTSAIFPTQWQQEGQNRRSEEKFALIIGKNRINFYKDSGISGATCDKMYSQSYVTLPGGFALPLIWVKETWYYADVQSITLSEETAESQLSAFAVQYLQAQMIAGRTMNAWEIFRSEEGARILQGTYACLEMIAQRRNEEIVKSDGKYH